MADKNFSDTLFDMACTRKLRELNLTFVPDLSLPGFSEALSKFIYLHSLRLSTISAWGKKFNGPILLSYISEVNLRSLSLDTISFSDD